MRYDDPSLARLAAEAERKYNLPPNILDAIRLAGERSNANQVSPAGAKGVYQFIPKTWASYGKGAQPTDPVAATDAAARMIADLMKQYKGNIEAVVAHYNGGGRPAKQLLAGQRMNPETAAYVPRVMNFFNSRQPEVEKKEADAMMGLEQLASQPEPQMNQPSSLDLETGANPMLSGLMGSSMQADSLMPEYSQQMSAPEDVYTQESMDSEIDTLMGLDDAALIAGIAGGTQEQVPYDLSSFPTLGSSFNGLSQDDLRAIFDETMADV